MWCGGGGRWGLIFTQGDEKNRLDLDGQIVCKHLNVNSDQQIQTEYYFNNYRQ